MIIDLKRRRYHEIPAMHRMFGEWRRTYWDAPVLTRELLRLPSCPLPRQKGRVVGSKIKLGQYLAYLADNQIIIPAPTYEVAAANIERVAPAEDEAHLPHRWRLVASGCLPPDLPERKVGAGHRQAYLDSPRDHRAMQASPDIFPTTGDEINMPLPIKHPLDLKRRTERRSDFGPWAVDYKRGVIVIKTPYSYEIDLDQCQTPESRLKKLEHVAKKLWVTPEMTGYLAMALIEASRPLPALASCAKGRTHTEGETSMQEQ